MMVRLGTARASIAALTSAEVLAMMASLPHEKTIDPRRTGSALHAVPIVRFGTASAHIAALAHATVVTPVMTQRAILPHVLVAWTAQPAVIVNVLPFCAAGVGPQTWI